MRLPFRRRLKEAYFQAIDVLHRPFVKEGKDDPYHEVVRSFFDRARALPSPAVLELGARNVTGVTRRHMIPQAGEYIGFDVLAGEGVDVVGDAHRLSQSLPADHFDAVYSISVFEHLLFPWKVVLELNRVMKTGGIVLTATNPAWPAHELPWDFFRYQPGGLRGLFNRFTGFEVEVVADGLPCKAYSLVTDPPTRPIYRFTLHQGVALIARKIGPYRDDLLRWNVDLEEVTDTMYPPRQPG